MSEQFDDASGGKSRVEIGLGCPHSSPQKESSVESLSLEDGVLGVYKHFFSVLYMLEWNICICVYVCMYIIVIHFLANSTQYIDFIKFHFTVM